MAVLIAMYLLRLRRRPLWISSTLFWHAAARDMEVNVPLRMIRPSWLLLLHAVVIAMAALAIGRPAIESATRSASRLVYLIDRSASMSATDTVDGSGRRITRLQAALDHARRSLRDLRNADAASAAIVTFASRPDIVSSFTNDWASLDRALGSIAPTDDPDTGIAESFELLRALLLDNAEESGPPARVVVISDGAPAPAPDAALPGAIVEFVRVGPDPALPTDNLGIVAMAARRAPETPTTVRVFARVINASASRRDAIITFSIDGIVAVSRPISVDPAASGTAGASVIADIDIPGESIITARIERPDVLLSDNEASIAIDAPRVLRVLLVSTSGDPDADGSWPILDVIREIPRTSIRTISAVAWNDLASSDSGSDLFADLIILAGVEPGWARSRPLAVPFLTFGVAPATPDVTLNPASPGKLIAWDRDHPLTRHLALDTVLFAKGGSFESPLGASVVPIAWSDGGIALACADSGVERWLAVAFDIAETNWPLQPSWPLFIENATDWLTRRSERESGRVWHTGEAITLRGVTPSTAFAFGRVGLPAVRTLASAAQGQLVIPAQPLGGVYAAESLAPPSRLLIPIAMLSDAESSCRTSDRISIGALPVEAADHADARRELWPWFVAALAVVLSVEWMIFASRSRVR